MKNKKTQADNFFDAIKNDPQAVIKWCENEIKEYKKLIRLIKKDKRSKHD